LAVGVFLEISLRIAEPYFPSVFVNDPFLGVRHKPLVEGANSLGFNDKEFVKEKNKKDAKFNFAVAAWMAANSSVTTLNNFYEMHSDSLKQLYNI